MKYDATRNIRKSHARACARHGSYCVIRTTHDTAISQGMTAMMVWEGSATVAGTHGPDISVIDAIDGAIPRRAEVAVSLRAEVVNELHWLEDAAQLGSALLRNPEPPLLPPLLLAQTLLLALEPEEIGALSVVHVLVDVAVLKEVDVIGRCLSLSHRPQPC